MAIDGNSSLVTQAVEIERLLLGLDDVRYVVVPYMIMRRMIMRRPLPATSDWQTSRDQDDYCQTPRATELLRFVSHQNSTWVLAL